MPDVVLAFGGFDPTGGAGILMDAKAVHAAGGYAAAVPSCLAIQTTVSFGGIVPIPRTAIDRALASAARSFDLRAVKIGVVGTKAAAEAILRFLEAHPRLPAVVDPVLRTSAGATLLRADALPAYRKVLRRATVLTPNLPEIEKILGRDVGSFDAAQAAASDLAAGTGAGVILKGGHFPWRGRRGTDIVASGGRVTLLAAGPRRPRDPHGTGCALAAAVAARVASGDGVVAAAVAARGVLLRMVANGFPSAQGRWTLCDGRAERGGEEAGDR